MTTVTAFYNPDHLIGEVYFIKSVSAWLHTNREAYYKAFSFETDKTGTNAAEEAFDVSNNPYREEERDQIVGRQRSLSVGDLVLVDENLYFCDRAGWTIVE
jgi:hypothetical protein